MLKFANSTCSVRFNDRIIRIAEGDPWHATDPFVLARPELFSDTPIRVYGASGVQVNSVETATRRPGERRTVRRDG